MSDQRPAVLIIEDNEPVRRLLLDVIGGEGFEVLGATTGAEALEQLRRGVNVCVILLDLMLPGMSGFEFRQQQQRDPALAHIPVVIISAYARMHTTVRRLDAVAYFEKPIDIDRLLETVARYCC